MAIKRIPPFSLCDLIEAPKHSTMILVISVIGLDTWCYCTASEQELMCMFLRSSA